MLCCVIQTPFFVLTPSIGIINIFGVYIGNNINLFFKMHVLNVISLLIERTGKEVFTSEFTHIFPLVFSLFQYVACENESIYA